MFRIQCAIATVLLLGLCVGCKKAAQETMERAIESQIAREGGKAKVELGDDSFSMQMQGEDGSTQLNVGPGTKIPEGFPKDVPLYPKMAIMAVHSQTQNQAFIVQATTPDSLDNVTKFYDDETKKNGWTEETSMNQADTMRMRVYKKGELELQVTLSSGDEGTTVSISCAQNE